MSYPRIDNYHNTHSFSISDSDIASVQWIEENADDDYIVLANQQVSAAALSQYGFKKSTFMRGCVLFFLLSYLLILSQSLY